MDQPITPLQQRILAFIQESVERQGYPPTVREIKRRLRVPAESSVAYHLQVLEAKGRLKRDGSSRGITLSETGLRLPILGRVGAGSGVIAQEDVEGYLGFMDFTLGSDFLLRVRGDSMTGAGIMEGDLVQVRRQPTAEDGDLVVALVEEEGVVKRLRRRGRAYELESANPKYPPITTDFLVIGKVLGLLRRYVQ